MEKLKASINSYAKNIKNGKNGPQFAPIALVELKNILYIQSWDHGTKFLRFSLAKFKIFSTRTKI